MVRQVALPTKITYVAGGWLYATGRGYIQLGGGNDTTASKIHHASCQLLFFFPQRRESSSGMHTCTHATICTYVPRRVSPVRCRQHDDPALHKSLYRQKSNRFYCPKDLEDLHPTSKPSFICFLWPAVEPDSSLFPLKKKLPSNVHSLLHLRHGRIIIEG